MILHWTKEKVDDGELGDVEDSTIRDWEAAQVLLKLEVRVKGSELKFKNSQ